MTATASSSISRRTGASGQRSPSMCSFRFSPEPTPQREAALQHDSCGCGGMGDHGGMNANSGTGHPGHDVNPVSRLCDTSEGRPHERAMTLGGDPRMEVVRDRREAEPRLLCPPRIIHQLLGPVLLGRDLVAELCHAAPFSRS